MFAVVDIETTGPKFPAGRIMEIAIVVFDGFEVVHSYQSLVASGAIIQPFVSNLTGISEDMLQNAPSFREVAPTINELTAGQIFVAHNVNFDYNFLQKEFQNIGHIFERERYCTLSNAKRLISGLPSYRLNKLCESLNIELENHHRAMHDAQATTKILEILLAEEKRQKPILNTQTTISEIARLGTLGK